MDTQTKKSDLPDRLKTAAVLIFIVLLFGTVACLSVLAARVFSALTLVVILAAGFEFCRLRSDRRIIANVFRAACLLMPAVCAFLLGFYMLGSSTIPDVLPYFLIALFTSGAALFWHECSLSRKDADLALLSVLILSDLLAFVLLGLGGSCLLLLAMFKPLAALMLIFLVAFADSSAYFVGRKLGGGKISELVSPQKTIAGTVAALILTSLVSVLCLSFFMPGLSFVLTAILGFLVALTSQAGDFAKSVIKRNHNVKDFSTVLPGHGGVFDRIDGLLGAAPLFLMISVFIWHF